MQTRLTLSVIAIAGLAVASLATGSSAAAAGSACAADVGASRWICSDNWSAGPGSEHTGPYAVYNFRGDPCEGQIMYQVKWYTAAGDLITEDLKDPGDNMFAFACVGPPDPTVEAWLSAIAPTFEVGHNPAVRSLVGLENWVWYEGETSFEPHSFDYVDISGIPLTLELRGAIAEYVWDFGDGPGSIFITSEPGSDENIDPSKISNPDGSQAAEYTWDTVGGFTMTATARWVGEELQRTIFNSTGWRAIPGYVEVVETWGPVDVIEVRTELTATDNG